MLVTGGDRPAQSVPSGTEGEHMQTVTITQLHKVEVARHDLAARGFTVVAVDGGGPWHIHYEEGDAKPAKKPRAKKAASE